MIRFRKQTYLVFFLIFTILTLFISFFSQTKAQEATESASLTAEATVLPTETLNDITPTSETTATIEISPTSEVTITPTMEVTLPVEITPEITTEATIEATAETTVEAGSLPVFLLAQTTFEGVPGIPLTLDFKVSDDIGLVRVIEDVTVTKGAVVLTVAAPIEVTTPYLTSVNLIYLPPANFSGNDTFTLTAIDTTGLTSSIQIEIQVLTAPTATPSPTPQPVLFRQVIEAESSAVKRSGDWSNIRAVGASGERIMLGTTGALTLPFKGSMVEVIYLQSPGAGIFTIEVDGVVQRTLMTDAAVTALGSRIVVDGLSAGAHNLRLYNLEGTVGIDSFVVESTAIAPTINSNAVMATTPVSNTYIINNVGDAADADLADNTCQTTVSGVCTLRAAIQQANATAGTQTFTFNIPGTISVKTIMPLSALPTITQPVIIDGYTQPGSAPASSISRAVLYIELNGAGIGAGNSVLTLSGGSSTVRGLVINRAPVHGLYITSTAASSVIQGNYIGTDTSGSIDLGNGNSGIYVESMNNRIGSTSPAARNIISGNNLGVFIFGSGAKGNLVQGNYIGTDVTGTAAVGNTTAGVRLDNAPNNTIGGTAAGVRNLISGNAGSGIAIEGLGTTSILVQGNYIGTDVTGTLDLGNSIGIYLLGAPNNTIGGAVATARNVISGNNYGIQIQQASATGNKVQGNYIGTNVTGTSALSNIHGLYLVGSASTNTIGGTAAGTRNLISGNSDTGVLLSGSGTNSNLVQGNYIGTDVTGTLALGNGNHGILIDQAANNLVGGTVAGARNLISANGNDGIPILGNSAAGNKIQGNYIGTNAAGTAALGNGRYGVFIYEAPNTTVGGTVAGARNLISGNGNHGVYIWMDTASGNLIQGNYIGTNAAGATALGNGGSGVVIDAAPNNTIGGLVAGARNLISGNTSSGISITNVTASGNLIQGNYIGTNVTGTTALGNIQTGVNIDAPNNTLGGTVAGARNLISGNGYNGIFIGTSATTSGNLVQGNYIGTNATGSTAISNGISGVVISVAPNNTIGGTVVGARNLISGNLYNGIVISGNNATGNLVQGNYIGTNATGTAALANNKYGIEINMAPNNLIGGTDAGMRNLISGNGNSGLRIIDSATINLVQGNYIGTNAAGTAALANNSYGIYIDDAPNNTIGGTVVGARNLISGNKSFGISVRGSTADYNKIQGNYIGTNLAGTAALANLGGGVEIQAESALIGGTTLTARNLISGNIGSGITITDGPSVDAAFNRVEGNYIGTNAAGTTALGNSGNGITISGRDSSVGSTLAGAGNLIAFNKQSGIVLYTATAFGNQILGNQIYANGQTSGALAIDLGNNGATLNDVGDGDTGTNDLQNYPVINTLTSTQISYVLDVAAGNYTIEFYRSSVCAPAGGQGEIFLGRSTITAVGSGAETFFYTFPSTLPSGSFVSLTATHIFLANTSEFSPCEMVPGSTRVTAAPVLTYPASNTVTRNGVQKLGWNPVAWATDYELQVATTTTFTTPTVNVTVPNGARSYALPTLADGLYYWRVRGKNSLGTGPYSSVFRITVDNVAPTTAPVIKTPGSDYSFVFDTTPTFTWSAMTGASEYFLLITSDTTCTTSVRSVSHIKTTSYTLPNDRPLPYTEGVYSWCLYGNDAAGWSGPRSLINIFTIALMKTPANHSATTDTTPTFTWNAITGANVTYNLVVSRNPDLSSPVIIVGGLKTTTYTPPATNALTTAGIYYWRVIVSGSSWSAPTPVIGSFLLTPSALIAPVLTTPLSAATISDTTPGLAWNAVATIPSETTTYELQVDNDSNFASPEINEVVTGWMTTYTPATALSPAKYYWRVRAIYEDGASGPWSAATRYFTITP